MLSASRRVSSARLTRTPCSGAFVALPAAAWRTQDPAPGDNFPVLPYRSDGKRDPSFGNGGKVSTGSAGESDTADSVTVATDGRIVMAGTSVGAYDGDDFAAARCTGGKRDSAFGTGGTVSTDFGSKAGHGNAVASRPPGRIVVAGSGQDPAQGENIALVRYQN